ncbi:DNA alkylation repair protein [Prevotella ihumii]|uniref:DNA alkylation repair protein n=1 Tax=Prevotella ihumii TaxID=1917878 RepID=UPI0009816317|nr:DNA alkylation repair protein [Prevotella ihumii]
MKEETKEKIKEIKRSFHLFMNGQASHSMREKGVNYKINWGIDLLTLRKKAKEIGKDYDLAIELWKEESRECKILATYIMPAEEMLPEVADIWLEQVRTQEIAEMLAFNLLRYVSFAPELAFRCLSRSESLYQVCGYQTLAGMFSDGKVPDERGINEFLDQAQVALSGNDLAVKQAAYRSVLRFCDMGEMYERIAQKALAGLDLL